MLIQRYSDQQVPLNSKLHNSLRRSNPPILENTYYTSYSLNRTYALHHKALSLLAFGSADPYGSLSALAFCPVFRHNFVLFWVNMTQNRARNDQNWLKTGVISSKMGLFASCKLNADKDVRQFGREKPANMSFFSNCVSPI